MSLEGGGVYLLRENIRVVAEESAHGSPPRPQDRRSSPTMIVMTVTAVALVESGDIPSRWGCVVSVVVGGRFGLLSVGGFCWRCSEGAARRGEGRGKHRCVV